MRIGVIAIFALAGEGAGISPVFPLDRRPSPRHRLLGPRDAPRRSPQEEAAGSGITISSTAARDEEPAARDEEAPPGFEPGMADLQSAALAAWLRRLLAACVEHGSGRPTAVRLSRLNADFNKEQTHGKTTASRPPGNITATVSADKPLHFARSYPRLQLPNSRKLSCPSSLLGLTTNHQRRRQRTPPRQQDY